MGVRSKLHDMPPALLGELERRLLSGGFSGYVALAEWLSDSGFPIGKSSVHRYGSKLEEKVAKLKASAERARMVVEASPDVADNMAQATMRLLQEKLYLALEEMDDLDPESMDLVKLSKAMAPLVRASIAQKEHADKVRQQLAEADRKLVEGAQSGRIPNVSAEALAQIRALYTGAVPTV